MDYAVVRFIIAQFKSADDENRIGGRPLLMVSGCVLYCIVYRPSVSQYVSYRLLTNQYSTLLQSLLNCSTFLAAVARP